ncbi:MAG: hypothetical protein OXC58_02635 [Acidimicrobiaceae bacterium]|nr:hypothetical protein [Acidimicrobiaceae bacterium]
MKGSVGIPAAVAAALAASLSPIVSMASGAGPTHVIAAAATALAKSAFSDRKP